MGSTHGRFVWYELMTTDVEAAKAFYSKVVGWTTRETPGSPYTLFTAGRVSAAGLTGLPPNAEKLGARPQWVGYISVDDVDGAVNRVKKLGGTVHIPPTDVPDVSRFSVVTDPQMATFILIEWSDPGRAPPIEPAAWGHVGWHELLANNWERAFAFYREIFGWQKAVADVGPAGAYQQFAIAGRPVGGMFNKPTAAPVTFWLYYFNVAEIGAAAERVTASGGVILEGPTDIPGGARVARCIDPQGAIFALIGKQSDKAAGYFEPAATRDSAERC
jgi:predicted enzyme related to lactoylglutathione lyase